MLVGLKHAAGHLVRRSLALLGVVLGSLLASRPEVRLALAQGVRRLRGPSLRRELQRYVIHRMLRNHPICSVVATSFGSELEVNTTDVVQRVVAVSGTWEPAITELVGGLLHPGDSFIDVGAHVGYFSLLAGQRIGREGYLRAFEASPTVFATLQANLSRNGIDPNRAENVAIVDGHDWVGTKPATWQHAGSITIDLPGSEEPLGERWVVGRSLASVLVELPPQRPLLVKLDIDGAEFAAREGIAELLRSGPAEMALLIEVTPKLAISPRGTELANGEQLVAELQAAGDMACFVVGEHYHLHDLYPSEVEAPVPAAGFLVGESNYLLLRGEIMRQRLASCSARRPARR